VHGPNLENLWIFSWRTSATLRLQGTVLSRGDRSDYESRMPEIGTSGQKPDEDSLNDNRCQNLNRGSDNCGKRTGS